MELVLWGFSIARFRFYQPSDTPPVVSIAELRMTDFIVIRTSLELVFVGIEGIRQDIRYIDMTLVHSSSYSINDNQSLCHSDSFCWITVISHISIILNFRLASSDQISWNLPDLWACWRWFLQTRGCLADETLGRSWQFQTKHQYLHVRNWYIFYIYIYPSHKWMDFKTLEILSFFFGYSPEQLQIIFRVFI